MPARNCSTSKGAVVQSMPMASPTSRAWSAVNCARSVMGVIVLPAGSRINRGSTGGPWSRGRRTADDALADQPADLGVGQPDQVGQDLLRVLAEDRRAPD